MKSIKTTGLVGLAFAFVALCGSEAAAQAPVLNASVNSVTVTLTWSAVPGATAYNLVAGTASGSSNIASVNLPTSITTVVVNAPVGTYYVRVRGIAGAIQGQFSNEAVVTVGGAPPPPPPGTCSVVTPPTVTASATGGSVSVNWTAVAGASNYSLQFSRFPGGTELTVNAPGTQTSTQQYVGLVGTFYVRIVAVTACGNATSQEVAFTIAGTAGSGPRTPDPAPGQLLPVPTYGAAISQQMASAYQGDLVNSCRETGGNNTYLFRLVQELRKSDSRWGLNDKRGQANDMSQDIVTYNPTNRPDTYESQIYLFDVISGHCGSRPDWNWTDVTAVTWGGRGNAACGTTWCARWTVDNYLRAGFAADPR